MKMHWIQIDKEVVTLYSDEVDGKVHPPQDGRAACWRIRATI